MVNSPEALLAAISRHWGMQEEAQTTPAATTNEDGGCVSDSSADAGMLVPDEPQFPMPTREHVCAKAGTFCGRRCTDVDRGARHLVYMIRHFPFRPFVTNDGGCGVRVAASTDWQADNADLIDWFHRLWWTAAGDAVLERYRDRLPVHDLRCPVVYGLRREGDL